MYKIILLSLFVILAGCSTSKEKIFKENMPTMKEVYEKKFHHLNTSSKSLVERPLTRETIKVTETVDSSKDILITYDSAYKKLQKQFPKAPNPTMMMHVFRHLTASGTPVPSYNTYFTLYESDHFILSPEFNSELNQ